MNRVMLPDIGALVGGGDPGALEACFAHVFGETPTRVALASRVDAAEASLVAAYRLRGYLKARLDPLGLAPQVEVPELDPRRYGLDPSAALVRVAALEAVYCGSIGWDIGHIHDATRRTWLERQAEVPERPSPTDAERVQILTLLARANAFEEGLRTRIPAGKLFGLGGAETFIVLLETLLSESVRSGVAEVVVGGMHRGRFNMLATVCDKPLTALIAEIEGKPAVPAGLGVSSDVSYHLGYSGERAIDGRRLRLSVGAHPSHLQLIPVISQGRARAKQSLADEGRRTVLPLLLHTDASFAGQGVVAEMLQLSRLAPFDVGGTIHVVINNQVGFTTTPEEGRSARHATDVAKLIEAPVLHVNGDDPEAVGRVARVAAAYRAEFGGDVLIDLMCYRRMGHNEIDEPRFTQPAMYRAVDLRPPVHQLYAAALAERGIDTSPAMVAADLLAQDMRAAFAAAKSYQVNHADRFDGRWTGLACGGEADMLAFAETGLPRDKLIELGRTITAIPRGMALDAKVARFVDERRASIEGGGGINWATGEALALASLLAEGTPVRLSGQDAVRGTFTQRHLELHDQTTGARHLVLAGAAAAGGVAAEIHNTPLIENAVLCFEYGISLADPHRLVAWEAQFGEFLNVAQAVFDQCIVCGEDRWLRASGLVILLPHGLDGGGPDHSTGRPERLLAACAGANIQIANASTPANFFHLLRRQMHRPFRKPLVVLSPKQLLRHKSCVSRLADFEIGTGFRTVISDETVRGARRVVLCTGKVFYELQAARATRNLDGEVALVRIEQLHPFPSVAIADALVAHPGAELVWCEEEPENMGYFLHLRPKLEAAVGRPVRRAGRPAVATPAVGVKYWHDAEIAAYLEQALSTKTT